MASFNLALCALAVLTCAACAALLFRRHQRTRRRVLFWSAVCFAFLTVNNVLLLLDLVVLDTDLRPWRHASAAVALSFVLYGLLSDAS
jgi:drug/metabolite transporter (DMT)-like permease